MEVSDAAIENPTACLPQELIASPVFLLGRLGYGTKVKVFEEFERAGFSPYHYSVLALLDEGARETQATIADALAVDRSTLVGLLDTLEERELIERHRDPGDRRRHVVKLTPAGKKQLGRFRKLSASLEADILAALDEHERATLQELLHRVAAQHDARYVTS